MVDGIFSAIAKLRFSTRGRVTIVGLGHIVTPVVGASREESERTEQDVQDVVEAEVVGCLSEMMKAEKWDDIQKEETLRDLRFVTMRHYLMKGDWRDVFDENEVQDWLN